MTRLVQTIIRNKLLQKREVDKPAISYIKQYLSLKKILFEKV